MPIEYEYDPVLNIVYCRPYGELSPLEIGDYFKKIVSDDEIKIGFVEVVRFKDVKNLFFSLNDAKHIIELYSELKVKKKIRTTIIIGESNSQFEIARMFKNLHDMYYPKGYAFIARNEEEAYKFINILCDAPPTKQTIKTAMA